METAILTLFAIGSVVWTEPQLPQCSMMVYVVYVDAWSLTCSNTRQEGMFCLQTFPELGCILSAEELDELESELDPLTVVADKLTAYNRQCLLGPAGVNPCIFGGIEGDLKGLGETFASCLRILGESSRSRKMSVCFRRVSFVLNLSGPCTVEAFLTGRKSQSNWLGWSVFWLWGSLPFVSLVTILAELTGTLYTLVISKSGKELGSILSSNQGDPSGTKRICSKCLCIYIWLHCSICMPGFNLDYCGDYNYVEMHMIIVMSGFRDLVVYQSSSLH